MKRAFLLSLIVIAFSTSYAKEESDVALKGNATVPKATAHYHSHPLEKRGINPATFSFATCQRTCFNTFYPYLQTLFLRRRGFFFRSRLLASINLNNCRRRCLDINECLTGAASCAPDATCIDTPGSFACVCNAGFEGDGTTVCTLMLGTADNPAVSCAAILSANPAAQSGTYFLRSANADSSDPSTSVFCDMTLDCDGVVGGWRQIADINPEIECPAGFMQFSSSEGVLCLSQAGPGCPISLPFPVNGIEYSQVCGQIFGIRGGFFSAFDAIPGATINDRYVNGISLTTDGSSNRPRTHIWTFAISNDRNSIFGCPCTSAQAPQPPNFVGSDYFCEGGGDLLWDGEICSVQDACSCTEGQGNGPPLFLRSFDSPIAEDVEVRLCADTNSQQIGIFVLWLYTR